MKKKMKNQEFRIDTEAGVVVFSQTSHGRLFTSISKVDDLSKFNVGIGQLIAMKRNEIKIRQVDIQSMEDVKEVCQTYAYNKKDTGGKLYSSFINITSDKISMSRNHIKELKDDLNHLYNGTYDVKPFAEIVNEHRLIRKGNKEVFGKIKCVVPQEIIDGTHIYGFANGSITIVPKE